MKITEFWTWFQQNEREIRIALYDKDQSDGNAISRLYYQLNEISPMLTCELKTDKGKKPFIITISCWGKRDAFLLVETLVAAAPKMEKWKAKAFIKPADYNCDIFQTPYTFFDWNVVPNTIKFAIYNGDWDREIFELLLLLPIHLRSKEETHLKEYFYSMFLDMWGEKFVGRRINDVFFTFHHDIEKYSYLELEDMHFVLENFKWVMGIEEG